MISGYWCKLRQVPLKVLPFCRVPVKFIGYLTRPLGFFFVSVDTDKSSRAQSLAMPRPAERIWGLTFANLRHSEIDRNFGVLRIYCRVLFAFGIAHFIESYLMTLFCLPDGSICRVICVTRNILTSVSLFLKKFIGHANSVPDGSSPRGYSQELVLGCRLHRLVSFAAIFIILLDIFIFIGCATSAPDGSSPRGYEQMLAFGHRLSPFLYCHTRNFLFFQSSPRAFGQKLVFDQRLPR
jgi:hypothetical protein